MLAPNLAARAQPQRATALRVLCAFQQPLLPAAPDAAPGAPRGRSDLFLRWAQIEGQARSQSLSSLSVEVHCQKPLQTLQVYLGVLSDSPNGTWHGGRLAFE